MKLKGEWDSGKTYDVGDVALYTNGNFYQMVRPGKAGVPCADALYWNILPSPLQECARMIMDSLAMAEDAAETAIGKKISDDAIALKGDDDKDYLITVDTSGDTPELVVSESDAEEADT